MYQENSDEGHGRGGQEYGRGGQDYGRSGDMSGGFARKKSCKFCADHALFITYKDPKMLKHFITERGKIIPRRISGNCSFHQRDLAMAIKRARNIALLSAVIKDY